MPLALLLAALQLAASQLAAGESGTPFTPADVLGRPGMAADNGLVTVGVSPLGGRVLRLDLGGRPLLWTAAKAIAAMKPPTGDQEEIWWYQGRGGSFFWPTPQAYWRRGDAPGRVWPPPPAIERGEMQIAEAAGSLALTGPVERNPLWRSLGMQAATTFTLPTDQSRLRIAATWTNRAIYPQRIGQWCLATLPAHSTGAPAEVVWPLRQRAPSRFGERGYLQHLGPPDAQMWQPDPAARLLRATCLGHPGKISSDSDGGWIAWRDPADGAALAIRFAPAADEICLPEGWSSIACNMMGDYGVEIEAMGPVLDLDPGQQLLGAWELVACRIAGPIRAVTAGGMLSEAPTMSGDHLRGSVGVFVRGQLIVRRAGTELASLPCTPTAALILDLAIPAGSGELELIVRSAAGESFPLITVPRSAPPAQHQPAAESLKP